MMVRRYSDAKTRLIMLMIKSRRQKHFKYSLVLRYMMLESQMAPSVQLSLSFSEYKIIMINDNIDFESP